MSEETALYAGGGYEVVMLSDEIDPRMPTVESNLSSLIEAYDKLRAAVLSVREADIELLNAKYDLAATEAEIYVGTDPKTLGTNAEQRSAEVLIRTKSEHSRLHRAQLALISAKGQEEAARIDVSIYQRSQDHIELSLRDAEIQAR